MQVLLFALVAFISIFVIVDFVEKLDDFIDQNVSKLIIVKYYIFQLPYIIVLTLPVAVLLSSLFSIGNLARRNEIVAMKASGVSLYRIIAPLLMLGFVISIFALVFGEYVLPPATEKMVEIQDEYLEKQRERWRKRIKDIYMRDVDNQEIIIRTFDAANNNGTIVSVLTRSGQEITKRIDADKIEWRDSVWVLIDGAEHIFKGDTAEFVKFDSLVLKSITYKPDAFSQVLKKTEEMSYEELKAFIQTVRNNGGEPAQWLVDLYLKISIPFASFIIVLFGAPLSSRKRRGGAATGFGISLAICFIYFGIVKTAQTMGHNGHLPPMLAAWIGNIVFAVGGVFVIWKAPK